MSDTKEGIFGWSCMTVSQQSNDFGRRWPVVTELAC